jgi:hypothetical protein
VPKEMGNAITPNRLDSFAAKAIEGLRLFFQMLLVVTHFLEGRLKEYFCLTPVVDEDFCNNPLVGVADDHHGIGVRE